MIHVIAEIEIQDVAREEFLAEFHRIVPIVRDEDGCLEYGPAVDHPLEGWAAPRPNVITVIEKWASVEALQAHLKAPHMEEYRRRADHMIRGVSIRTYEPA